LNNERNIDQKKVTYSLEYKGKFFVIENVPAHVCQETGEKYFAPDTVQHIQDMVKTRRAPKRVIETPVYDYA